MAANQISNQRRSSGTHQSQKPTPQTEPVHASEAGRDYGLSDVTNQASEYWAQGQEQMKECVRGREGAAMLMAVGAGLGLGLMIGVSLGRSHAKTRSWRDRVTAEGFGRRLMDRIESMIPEALSDHFGK